MGRYRTGRRSAAEHRHTAALSRFMLINGKWMPSAQNLPTRSIEMRSAAVSYFFCATACFLFA